MRISGLEEENKAVVEVARLMLLAARTAPKGKGIDDIDTLILTGKEKDAVAKDGYPTRPPIKFHESASTLYINMMVAKRTI